MLVSWSDIGSRTLGRAKPPNSPTAVPADWAADMRMLTTRPRARPMKTWMTVAPINPAVSVGRAAGGIWPDAASARPAASPTLAGSGMLRWEKGGVTTSHAEAQMNARNPARTAPGSSGSARVVPLAAIDEMRQHLEGRVGEGHDPRDHPVTRYEQDHGHAQQLRDEAERELLDLGHRLE